MSFSKLIHGFVIATAGGLFFVHVVPNVYPSVVVQYQGLHNVEVTQQIEDTFLEVATQMNLTQSNKVKLFINNGSSNFSAGSTLLPGGAVIGISRLFLYSNQLQLSDSGLAFKGKKINMNSKAGQKLSQFLLSDKDELKFTLAHEITHIKYLDFITDCFLPSWWLYFTYRAIPIVAAFCPPNMVIKTVIQSSLWLLSYWLFTKQNIALHHKREFFADENAALVGVDYAKGGINATIKKMKMNEILRSLHGKDGKHLYSLEGNDLHDWMHPKLSERLRKLEEIYVANYIEGSNLLSTGDN